LHYVNHTDVHREVVYHLVSDVTLQAQAWGSGEADSETSYRISAVEGARDLAVMETLLGSGAAGSLLLPVETFGH
jgi:hypothetical protein